MGLSDIAIGKKIGAAFVAIVLGAAVTGVFVMNNIADLEHVGAENRRDTTIAISAIEARFYVTRQEGSLRGYMITKDPYLSQRVKDHWGKFKETVAKIRSTDSDPALGARLDELEKAMTGWQENVADPVIKYSANDATYPQALEILMSGAADKYIDPVETILDGLRDEKKAAQEAAADLEAHQANLAGIVMMSGIAALVVLALGLGMVLYRSIALPIRGLTKTIADLTAGNRQVSVPSKERGDEIGAMAKAVETFRQSAIEQKRLEEEAERLRESQEAERQRQAAIEHEKAERLESFIADIGQGFERLSDGDLTARLDRPVAAEFETIRGQFNGTVEKLETTLGSVVNSIGSIRTGLDEINTASNDLAHRTEQQAASLEETAAAISEVARGVNATAESADRSQKLGQVARANAEKGGQIVGRAIEAMSEIEKSSEEIGKIIGVIDEIAFQTNLLALNAGVEAARAGEAGKGFAVVAQEVRALAQRSADAAKEIKELISKSGEQVGRGVELVTASGKSLEEIVAQVAEMAAEAAQAAKSTREQAANLKEVSSAADQMDKVTQQNAAMVEETTAAAQTLANETDHLAQLISQFRTAASAGHASQQQRTVRRQAAAPAPVSRATPRPTAKPAPRPVQQMKTVSAGGGAAPKSAPADEGWEEF